MRNLGRIFVAALLWSVALAVSAASAQGCGPRIRTVETMISRLTETAGSNVRSGTSDKGLWMIDITAARRELEDAREYQRDGLELGCQLHVAEALRRLGRQL